jgi:transcriptional regulator with XRE-family HTH domain
MTKILDEIEDMRLRLGLTQLAVARSLGITQPHYSKVIGRTVGLSDHLALRMIAWTKDQLVPAQADEENREMLELTRSIERQSKRLATLLAQHGRAPTKRRVTRTRTTARGA